MNSAFVNEPNMHCDAVDGWSHCFGGLRVINHTHVYRVLYNVHRPIVYDIIHIHIHKCDVQSQNDIHPKKANFDVNCFEK